MPAVTGSTGSGRKPIDGTHHPLRHSDLYAYSALAHRHAPEIIACAQAASGVEAEFDFVPHSGPFARGIHVTVQATLRKPVDSGHGARPRSRDFYAGSPFVRVGDARRASRTSRPATTRSFSAVTNGRTRRGHVRDRQSEQGRRRRRRAVDEPPAAACREHAGLTAPAAGLDLTEPQAMACHSNPHQHARTPSHLAQVFAQYPIEIAHGEGVWLHARDGRKMLDLYGGHAVAGLGYGHPRWTCGARAPGARRWLPDATRCRWRCASAPRRAWSRFAGLDCDSVFFVNSGAEANENALKMAFTVDRAARTPSRSNRAGTAAPPPPAP